MVYALNFIWYNSFRVSGLRGQKKGSFTVEAPTGTVNELCSFTSAPEDANETEVAKKTVASVKEVFGNSFSQDFSDNFREFMDNNPQMVSFLEKDAKKDRRAQALLDARDPNKNVLSVTLWDWLNFHGVTVRNK